MLFIYMERHVPAHGVGGLLSQHCLLACCVYSYLLFRDQAVMAKLEFSILHCEHGETHCQMIYIFFQALETLQGPLETFRKLCFTLQRQPFIMN